MIAASSDSYRRPSRRLQAYPLNDASVQAPTRKPDFFIVGSSKCGTTSMCSYLRQHPDVLLPEEKEFNFFGSDLCLLRPCIDLNEYLGYFQYPKKDRAGECSPWYLYSRTAAQQIIAFNKNARIIIMLRNPLDALHSLFRFRQYVGTEKESSLLAVLQREIIYLQNHHEKSIDAQLIYQDTYRYHDQVKRYFDVFTPSCVHIVIYDDLQQDVSLVYRGILEFLKVQSDFQPEFAHLNKTGRIRSASFQWLISRRPAPIKRLAYMFPRSIRRPAYQALHRLNTSYAPSPPMDPGLRRQLKNAFRPDVERLSELIKRDLTHWTAD